MPMHACSDSSVLFPYRLCRKDLQSFDYRCLKGGSDRPNVHFCCVRRWFNRRLVHVHNTLALTIFLQRAALFVPAAAVAAVVCAFPSLVSRNLPFVVAYYICHIVDTAITDLQGIRVEERSVSSNSSQNASGRLSKISCEHWLRCFCYKVD